MAEKLVAARISVGLMMSVCLAQLVVVSFVAGNKEEAVYMILSKPSAERSEVELKSLSNGARRALSAESESMSIGLAVQVAAQLPHQYAPGLSQADAQNIIYLSKITANQCDELSLVTDFERSLFFVMKNKTQLPKLHEFATSSLERYMNVCGLEERYRQFVKQSAPKRREQFDPVAEPSLASKIMNEFPSRTSENLLWSVALIRDPRFNSAKAVKCEEDRDFIGKITAGLIATRFEWLHEYTNRVFDDYLKDCGYEKNFGKVSFQIMQTHMSLASYLKGPGYVSDGNKMVWLIEFINYLGSLKRSGKESCPDVGVTSELAERMGQIWPFKDSHRLLFNYIRKVFMEHLAICNYRRQFETKLYEFKLGESTSSSWELIGNFVEANNGGDDKNWQAAVQDYLAKNRDNGKRLAEACGQLWKQTYGSLIDALFFDSHLGVHGKELRYFEYCAIVLEKPDGYVRRLLRDQY